MYMMTRTAPSHASQMLARAAHLLRHARSVEDLSEAIANNLNVWITMTRTLAPQLPAAVAADVPATARHVIETTLHSGRMAPTDTAIEGFIRLNETYADRLRPAATTVSA